MMELEERLGLLRRQIECHATDPSAVTLVAVTKRFGLDVVRQALAAGLLDLGENYAQELQIKAAEVVEADVRWHMIGPVQRNKVKRIAASTFLWHTVDRAELAAEIAKRAPGARVLLQVNTTEESHKSGCPPAEAEDLLAACVDSGLDALGLMTMGPSNNKLDPRPAFRQCRKLADSLGLKHCSMGMSGDVTVALEEGATIIRVGSALFGQRSP